MSSPQARIGSGFNAASTAADVIHGRDLHGKVAIVTGGNSGIGLETTRALQSAGATVIVPARSHHKAMRALADLDRVEIESLDLLDPASIDAFATRFLASGRPLHILVNNAGIMACPLTRDARGYEAQFATNHLGHFQLTLRLWHALRQAQGARVISLASRAHQISPVFLDDPNFERREYTPFSAYGQSKTANILFALALDARGAREGVRAFSAHPGIVVATALKRYLSAADLRAANSVDEDGNPILDPTRNLKTIAQGAATSVWCATSPQLDDMGGVYCENCDIAVPVPPDAVPDHFPAPLKVSSGVMPWATDADAAVRLWSVSQKLIDELERLPEDLGPDRAASQPTH